MRLVDSAVLCHNTLVDRHKLPNDLGKGDLLDHGVLLFCGYFVLVILFGE